MKLSQQNVFKVLAAVGEKGATTKEILSALAQKKKRKAQLRKILKGLLKEKTCHKQNNRYSIVEEARLSTRSPMNRNEIHPKQASRRKRNKELIGQVLYRSRKYWIHSFDQQKQFELAQGGFSGFLHGDLVHYNLQNRKRGNRVADVTDLIERRITLLKGKVHTEKKGRQIFFPDNSLGIKQFNVKNKIPLLKDQQGDAWFEVSKNVFVNRKADGEARLIPEKSLHQNPILEDILIQNKIPTQFPNSVLAECNSLPANVRVDKISIRRDLRDLPFVTIDGADAKDFDDAIYAIKEGEGYRIWVSIADVAAYVPPGSVIDREAFSRGTSTYLPGIAYPMLPEALSNGLCSLKEGVNRKTVTCESLIDKNGKTKSTQVYASFNRIACRLTYSSVDKFYQTGSIKQRKNFTGLSKQLLLYREIAMLQRQRRIKSGFIDFQLPESKFQFDQKGWITNLQKSYQTVAMQVIEQFMLLANENVAKFCHRNNLPIIWRNHSKPLPEKLENLKKLFWNNKIKLPLLSSGKDYNQAMALIKKSPEKDFLENAMLRSMSLAVYETNREGHFGIASEYYCHFTSPIRRYPDLMVHRALKNHLRNRKAVKISDTVATVSSNRERLATSAERAASKFFKLHFMADKIGKLYEAKISGLIHVGVFIEIEEPYVEGFVPFATIHDDHYEYDEESKCIWGRNQRTRYTIGKKLEVLLTRLDWGNLSPEFDWICWKDEV